MTNIRNDLEAEFGPIPEEEETGPWNIAVGFPYSAESQYADPVVSTKKPAAKQTEEKVQPDELSAQLALAIGSGDRERIEKALDESLEEERSQKVELSVEPTLPDRPYNGQVVKRCISCGQRIVWRPSEGECLCSVKCRRHYEKQTGRKTRTTLEMEAKSVREHKDRKARDREAVDCATRKERARATRDAFIFGPTIKSLQRQFVEQHDIHANFVKVCHVQGYPVLSFTMTNRQDQPLYVIQYEDRHGWILGALSAEQAVTDWLAHRAISGAQ
jgi:predicted nucleic acid-binding Zn ribbon protein